MTGLGEPIVRSLIGSRLGFFLMLHLGGDTPWVRDPLLWEKLVVSEPASDGAMPLSASKILDTLRAISYLGELRAHKSLRRIGRRVITSGSLELHRDDVAHELVVLQPAISRVESY